MTPTSERKSQLVARLKELDENLHEIEDTLDEEPNPDVEDRASEREGDEVLEGLGNLGILEIQMINAALNRIEEGSYGDCAKCGEIISAERLDLLPHTPLCRNCAK